MIIYPAIDIRRAKCVRLFQGDPDKETIYADDPVEVARRWQQKGASWLHVVDLDGAFSGRPMNHEIVLSMVRSVNLKVQVGGGIRSEEDVRLYLLAGVDRVVIGTRAFGDMGWFTELCYRYPDRIALGLDARDGLVAVKGWRETMQLSVLEVAKQIEDIPVGAIIYTDISRDGTHKGVNIEATEKLLELTSHPVIASGGVSSLEDIRKLLPLREKGLEGVIIGRALYDGKLALEDALGIVREKREGEQRWQ